MKEFLNKKTIVLLIPKILGGIATILFGLSVFTKLEASFIFTFIVGGVMMVTAISVYFINRLPIGAFIFFAVSIICFFRTYIMWLL